MMIIISGCVPPPGGGPSARPASTTTGIEESEAKAASSPSDVFLPEEAEDWTAWAHSLQERSGEAGPQPVEPAAAVAGSERWAILGCPAIQELGLTDLATVHLSAWEGIEVVERAIWESLAAEYALSTIGAADSVRQRLQLGQVLAADRLLVLAQVDKEAADAEPRQLWRWVLADCQTGARLDYREHPAETGVEAFLEGLVQAVGETRRRFPEGVQRVVGLSHFLSRNLTHHYDHWQAGYAYLLQHALGLHPGTAVLEIEEARAVAKERSLATADRRAALGRRAVPVLVDGEFTVHDAVAAGPPTLDVTVFLRRGDASREIRRTGLSPDRLVRLLTAELPREILERDDPQPPFSRAEQRDWLVRQARQFGRVGAWQHSLGLREAALLIDPENVPLRLDTIKEYSLQMCRPLPMPVRPEQVPGEDELRRAYRQRVEAFRARLAHIETLIRHRQLGADQLLAGSHQGTLSFASRPSSGSYQWLAASQLHTCFPRKIVFEVYAPREAQQAERRYAQLAREEFAAAERSQALFMDTVYPQIPRLYSVRHGAEGYGYARAQWAAYLLAWHRSRWSHDSPQSPEQHARLYRTLLETLDLGDGLSPGVRRQWAEYLLEYFERQTRSEPASPEILDSLYHVLSELFPGAEELHRGLLEQIRRLMDREVQQQLQHIERPEAAGTTVFRAGPMVAFCQRLAQHDRRTLQLYGRFGLLYRRWLFWDHRWRQPQSYRPPGASEWSAEQTAEVRQQEQTELLAELAILSEELEQLETLGESQNSGGDPGAHLPFVQLRRAFRRRRDSQPADGVVSRPTSRPDPAPPWTHYPPGEEDRLPRFQFAGPVDMVVTALTGESRPVNDPQWRDLRARWGRNFRWSINTRRYPIIGWRKCHPRLDVLWNELAVLIMREKGRAREIFCEPETGVREVVWDGSLLWVLTRRDGLRVLSPCGRLIQRIDADDGLPPYDGGVVLSPVRPGVVFLAGSFGPHHRGWCALVDRQQTPPVRVIHQATIVRSHVAPPRETDPAEWTFIPTYVHAHQDSQPDRQTMMVGWRSAPGTGFGSHAGTLFVDLDSLQRNVSSRRYENWMPDISVDRRTGEVTFPVDAYRSRRDLQLDADFLFYSSQGRLFLPTGLELLELSGGRLWDGDSLDRHRWCENGAGYRYLLPLGDWLYLPDDRGHWYRIHRETFQQQPLVQKPSPHPGPSRQAIFRVSAHYGILYTSNHDGLHYAPYQQIRLEEPP